MNMNLSIAFHLIGIVLWIGGTMVLTRVLALALEDRDSSNASRWAWRGYVGYVLPGAVIAVLAGLNQIVAGAGAEYYFKQGWFHGKLTLVLIMIAATVFLGIKLKGFKEGRVVTKGSLMAVHGIAGIMLLGGVFLTILGRAS